MNIHTHACIGGKNVGEDVKKLQQGQQIVSGTPGRVIDVIKEEIYKLEISRFLF